MKSIKDIENIPQKSLVERYILGIKEAYCKRGGTDKWTAFEDVVEGASEEDLQKIKELYPDVPASLIELLSYIDGTYFREYKDKKICLYLLGSALEEYPYYLLSSQRIVKNEGLAYDYYSEYVNREFDPDEGVDIDGKIVDDASKMKWLHFSDCMNNGGTSQLFIDFSPSPSGKAGQVVMFVHDPDSLEVIADSFDEYLSKMIDTGFDFIFEDDY